MGYQNIVFKGVGVYHPKRVVSNSYFVNHFHDMGVDITHLLNSCGRENRYFADKKCENVVTMATQASEQALNNANLEAKDIDAIIFATDTPEYLCPTNALLLNDALHAENANLSFDINTNCTGMLTGIDVASRLLMSNHSLKRILLAGSMFASLIANKRDPVIYSNFADSAAAIILECSQENRQRGFIDSNFKTDTFEKRKFLNPPAGMTKIYDDIPIENKKFSFDPKYSKFVASEWTKLITNMLTRNDITVNQIKQFFFSQYSLSLAEETLKEMNLTPDRHTYVGNKYGYTGVTSPILALDDALKHDILKDGDLIVFCSIGAGYNICSILYQL